MWHSAVLLRGVDSLAVTCGLSRSLAYGILVPRPGTEPESPELQGGFLTIGPPGMSLLLLKKNKNKKKQKHILSYNQTTHAKQHIGS